MEFAYDFLTDTQVSRYVATHTVLLFSIVPWVVTFTLKLVAIISPRASTNRILELFQNSWPGKKIIVNDTPIDVIK